MRGRMEFIVVASNERQKELESTWSTVKNLDESVQSLTVQIKQRLGEIESLLTEEDPKKLSRRVKVTYVHFIFFLPIIQSKSKNMSNCNKRSQLELNPIASYCCDKLSQAAFINRTVDRGLLVFTSHLLL